MKLETKISLTIIITFLTFGVLFLMTGFSISGLLNNSLAINKLVAYGLLPLLIIGFFILVGFMMNRKIKKPLTFFIRWIDQLSLGIFKMPETIHNKPTKDMNLGPFLELKSKLTGLTNQLSKVAEERNELEDIRRKWTAGVTHDLKTPLSYVKGYAAMLRSEHTWCAEEIREFATIIEEKSIYMEQLIDDLSIVYEFDNIKTPVNIQPMDLVPFVKNVLKDFRKYPVAQDYSIVLNCKQQGEMILSCDNGLLKRALENIIMNAISHNPPGTIVTISLAKTNDVVTIAIDDNGIGMDEEVSKQLFNQYYRGTTTDQSPLGSGLGMSIAKQFIEKQGGKIKVESKLNQGTKIIIRFPKE